MSELKNIKSFSSFTDKVQAETDNKLAEEKSQLQKDYADYFMKLLQKYDVGSPAELDDEGKAAFFDEVSAGWDNGEGMNAKGEESVEAAEEE